MFSSDYESSLEGARRRQNGIHYTSEENILKVIKPLFLEGLQAEFEQIKVEHKQLLRFQNKVNR